MPIVTQCTARGCETLTMGTLCVAHDSPVQRAFVRGRPFVRKAVELRLATSSASSSTLRTTSERAAAVPSLR